MGKVISILDYRSRKTQKSLNSEHFDNTYDFLRSEYGDGAEEWLIEVRVMIYRSICYELGEEVDYEIMRGQEKKPAILRGF